ncbi:DUF885 domain-containing protein [Hirschia litorea]|uniref:DUF885 domain-containing protein n=1 Tax=Hirschia litorea TaxID=1199156 RepID=A0ABW2ILM8_9PROT
MRHSVSILALTLVAACASSTETRDIASPETAQKVQTSAAPAEEVQTPTAMEAATGASAVLKDTTKEARAKQAQTTEQAAIEETEKLYAFFSEQFDARIARSPMFQTSLGLKTNYNQWDDPSDEADIAHFKLDQAAASLMEELVDYDALTPDGQLSYRLFKNNALQQKSLFPFRHHNYVFDQMNGVQSSIPAFLINQHRIKSVSDADAYIERLNGIPEYLGGHLKNAQMSAEKGIRPPKFVYKYVRSDIANVLKGAPFSEGEDSPLFNDFKEKVNALDISSDEKLTLIMKANAALITSVQPAYEQLSAWLESDLENATDDDGSWKLPDGASFYQQRLAAMTTTDLSAAEIHTLGLKEVDRIHSEMRNIMQKVEFKGNFKEFFEFMRTDPQFYYSSDEEGRQRYIKEATQLIDTMKTKLPSAFNTFPKADLIVKRVEPFREKSAGKAFYQRPAADGSRPGTYYANLYNMNDMPTYQMEALAYHEGIPGHHMQLAISQELENVPRFRKYGRYTAYTEGWGLYTEYLPKEMGFYQDPYSDFGRLAMELWRAARLVVDTGIHDKKWTREQATQYLMTNTPNPEGDCIKAIDRYIVMPGQATAYKIGMLKILEVREKARAAMGANFSLAEFHDILLASGPIPLSELELSIDQWISESTSQS